MYKSIPLGPASSVGALQSLSCPGINHKRIIRKTRVLRYVISSHMTCARVLNLVLLYCAIPFNHLYVCASPPLAMWLSIMSEKNFTTKVQNPEHPCYNTNTHVQKLATPLAVSALMLMFVLTLHCISVGALGGEN